MFAYPSEGVGEPRPMEPDPEAKEDDEDSGVSGACPLCDTPNKEPFMHMPLLFSHAFEALL